MDKERIRHALRLLLIAALLVSAVLLARETGDYRRAFERISGTAAETEESGEILPGLSAAELARSVRPRTVLVRLPDGGTAASAYAGEETEAAFHRFSAILGEALGSAGEPEEIDENTFRAGLDAGCVFVDFFCNEPLGLLAHWLGSEMQSAAALSEARFLYLGLTDSAAQLCFRGSDGGFFRCSTAAISETLAARMAEMQGVSAHFAYEDPDLARLEPYTVLLAELPAIPSAAGFTVRDGIDTAELMRAVGMNSYVASSYLEADGTRVFIDGEKSLRIAPDATVTFRASPAEDGDRIAEGMQTAVSYACAAAVQSTGRYAGQAEILLTGVSFDGEDEYTVTFDYCIGGIPLRLTDGSAAQIRLRGGQLVQMNLVLRSYVLTGGTETLLPMRQAAAIANASGVSPTLVYADRGDRVECVWIRE